MNAGRGEKSARASRGPGFEFTETVAASRTQIFCNGMKEIRLCPRTEISSMRLGPYASTPSSDTGTETDTMTGSNCVPGRAATALHHADGDNYDKTTAIIIVWLPSPVILQALSMLASCMAIHVRTVKCPAQPESPQALPLPSIKLQ